MTLPEYVREAIDEYAKWRVDRTRSALESAILRFAKEYSERKMIESQPDTFNQPRDVPEDLPIG
jgi:hypothetical protein